MSFFTDQWNKNRKWDPVTHRLLEAVVKNDSKNVKKGARGLAGVFGGDDNWLGARFNDLGDEAQKNEDDPARGIGRAATTVGLLYGGYLAAGAGAGAGTGAVAAEGTGAGAAGAGLGDAAVGTAATGGGTAGGGAVGAAGGGAATGGGAVAGTGLTATPGAGLTLAGTTGSGTGLAATTGSGMTLAGTTGSGTGLSTAGTVAGGTTTGLSSTGLGPTGQGGSASSGVQWNKLMQMRGLGQQQQQQPYEWQEEVPWEVENPYIDQLAASSKRLKEPAGNEREAVARGLSLAHPVDANGVQIEAIKALAARIQAARVRLAKLRRAA